MENGQKIRSGIMRLYNFFYVCKSCLPNIQAVSVHSLSDKSGFFEIKNWKGCKESLDILKKIECFDKEISRLYKLLDWRIDNEEIRLPSDKMKIFDNAMIRISTSVEMFIKLCDMLEMGEAESGIDVKIPKCETLKEYMGYLKEIDFIFTQCPYLLHEKEEIRFNNVDVGSQWLAFAVAGITGSFYILNNLAKIVQKVIAIKSNILVYRQQEEMLKEMQLKNEVAEETVETFKKFKQTLLNDSVSELEQDIGELQNGEERDKVKKTIENMAILMDKGVEIYSSIETPKEIKVLFPFEKDTAILPDNITKLLEEKEGE